MVSARAFGVVDYRRCVLSPPDAPGSTPIETVRRFGYRYRRPSQL
jgi:hypothetical protein